MRARKHMPAPAFAGMLLLGLCHASLNGQERPAPAPATPPAEERTATDLPNLHPFHRALYLSAFRGAEWLWQNNRPDGLFVPGHIPSLGRSIEEDSFISQAVAAHGLARAARFTGQDRYAVRARQAALALLASTRLDPQDAQARFTTFPPEQVSRTAAGAWLVLMINELPSPGEDLLEQSEQLCRYLAKQQVADGSFLASAGAAGIAGESAGLDGALAMAALMRSQAHRPAPWKTEAVRRGLAIARQSWSKQKNPAVIPWMTSAATELALSTREQSAIELVFEINDWLCTLQFGNDPRRPLWQGGFAEWQGNQPASRAPSVECARYAASLADACRLARQAGDLQRFPRYREASERCLQFLTTLQYTSATTRHFADGYRGQVLGGFHYSHREGNLRLEDTPHVVCALTQYLQHVANVTPPGSLERKVGG